MDTDRDLTPWQRQLLHVYRGQGAATIVLTISAISVTLSVTAVVATLLALDGTREEWVSALTMAVVIPAFVAPVASTLVVRLLGTIVEARDRLEVLASTDALTGLANRRRFFTVAERLAAERDDGEVVIVGISDMNGFKAVNDTHGHAMGDAALQQLARLLERAVEGVGLAARMGGDEFACVVRVPGERSAAVRAGIAAACADIRFGDELRLAAGLGFSEVEGPGDVDAALSRADVALYMEKAKLGRRRTDRAPAAARGVPHAA